jgi:hypothetical protein
VPAGAFSAEELERVANQWSDLGYQETAAQLRYAASLAREVERLNKCVDIALGSAAFSAREVETLKTKGATLAHQLLEAETLLLDLKAETETLKARLFDQQELLKAIDAWQRLNAYMVNHEPELVKRLKEALS